MYTPGFSASLSLFDYILELGIAGGLDGWDQNSRVCEARFDTKQKGDKQVLEQGHIVFFCVSCARRAGSEVSRICCGR
jgi:hypothetical protein